MRILRRLLLLAVILAFAGTNTVSALAPEQKRVISSGAYYFNIDSSVNCSTASISTSVGGSLYVLGDSITVGMRDAGSLDAKLRQVGWDPVKINAVGGQNINWGRDQLSADGAILAGAQTLLVGLGTNNVGDVAESDGSGLLPSGKETIKSHMQQLIDVAKAANPSIKIYWTSVYMTGTLSTRYGDFDMDAAMPVINEALSEIAATNSVTVIPYGSSAEAPQLTSSDGIHPSGKYTAMADYIVSQLGTKASDTTTSASGCCKVGYSGANNRQRVFNFFVSKGYSPAQAAGVVGNMMAESGVLPMREQGQPQEKLVSSADVKSGAWSGGPAWGIVQWDPPTKMIDPSLAAGKTYEEIDSLDYQLEFLWGQLTGTGIGAASNEKAAGDAILATTTLEEATIAFGRRYERFRGSQDLSNPEYAKRIGLAQAALSELGGGAGAGVGCNSAGAGANGWDLPGTGPNPMVYYSQRSSKTGNVPEAEGYFGQEAYGHGTIGQCGCGPTSFAMAVSTLTGNRVEPPEMAQWSAANGGQYAASTGSCGSNWFWEYQSAQDQWGVNVSQITTTDEAAAAVRSGALVIISSNVDNTGSASPFTTGGHILLIRAVTDDGRFLFADPNDHAPDSDNAKSMEVFGQNSKSNTPIAPEQFMPSIQGMWVITAK